MKNLFITLFIALYFFSSCSDKYKSTRFQPVIHDSINLTDSKQKQNFDSLNFPKGVIPVLTTINTLDSLLPGSTADSLFEAYAENDTLDGVFEERGLLILVSKSPKLIQVRAGSEYSNHLRWKGIIAGEEYLTIQQTALNDSLEFALDSLFSHLERRLPEVTDISWWDKAQYNQAAQFIGDEIEEFGLPSESFYSNAILKPVLKLRVWELNKTGTWWITYLLVALTIFLLTKIIEKIVALITEKFLNKSFRSLVTNGLSFVLGIYLSIPTLSSATVLSSGRMEDILTLQASGIPFGDFMSVSAANYGIAAPLWLIAILAVAGILKGMAPHPELLSMTNLPDKMQIKAYKNLESRNPFTAGIVKGMATKGSYFDDVLSEEEFMEKPYHHAYFNQFYKEITKAGLWSFLAFTFLSKAVVIAAIFLWIFPILEGYFKHYKVIKNFNKNFPNYKTKFCILFILPIAFFLLFYAIGLMKSYPEYIQLFISILLSSGILLSAVINNFITTLSGWQIWVVFFSLPAYFLVRLAIALFQTDEILRKQFIKYAIVTVLSLLICVGVYFKVPEYNVQKSVTTVFPKTERLLRKQKSKEKEFRKGVINGKVLNMRKAAGTNYEIEYKLTAKDTFEIINADSSWWKIRFKQKKGYIFGKYANKLMKEKGNKNDN